jgi:hypothetical protein
MIFERYYQAILGACQDIVRRRERVAKPLISDLLLSRVGPEVSSDALLAHIFAESLLRRIDRNLVIRKNIYLETFEVSQIDLFYLMCRAYPQVTQGHTIADQFLSHELRQHEKATIFEIGVGKGLQMSQLLRKLSTDPGKLQELHLVALDPDPQNLADATRSLAEIPLPKGLRLHLHPLHSLIENLSPDAMEKIAELTPGRLVVNSAYTLHHTIHPLHNAELRTQILSRINQHLSPRLVTFVEPSSDHDTEHMLKRLTACWEHFGNVFDVIDLAKLEPEMAFTIKETFFGREIRDIFGTADAFRCERHERYESWLLRLTKAGFRPYLDVPHQQISTDMPSHCTTATSDGLVRMGYKDVHLVAVFAYQSDGRANERSASALGDGGLTKESD